MFKFWITSKMMKSIGILLIHGNHLTDDLLDIHLKDLIEGIPPIGYEVSKISIIQSGKKLIVFELKNLLKQNEFVLLIDKSQTALTFKYLNDLFNFQGFDSLNYPHFKSLVYDNRIKLKPVIYLSRLFIIQDNNLKLVFDNILKDFLKQFNKEKIFRKNIQIVSCDLLDSIDGNDFNVEIKVIEEKSAPTIQLQSCNFDKLIDCQRYVQKKTSNQCYPDVYSLETSYGNKHCFDHIKEATKYIEKCFSDYGLENVFISFNGGKDCTVLLHLVLGILRSKYPDYKNPVVCMYVQSSNPFPEVNHFIEMIRDFYNLDIVTITKCVREGLESFLESRSNMKACLMGTRRTDPYSESLQIFQMTDSNWPQVMRVSPLLDWHYSEIWDYVLYYQVPYCSLYDEGYTSLGGVNNTIRNPNLLYNMDDDSEIYLPAYKLLDGNTERNGRT